MCDFSRMPTFSILNDTDLGLSDAVYKSWVLCCNCKFCTYTSCIHISIHMKTECVHDTWKQLASRFICITRLLFTISRVEENSGRVPLSPPIRESIVRQHVLYAHNLRNFINQTQLGVETYRFIYHVFILHSAHSGIALRRLVSPVVLLALTTPSTPTVATTPYRPPTTYVHIPHSLGYKFTLAETL